MKQKKIISIIISLIIMFSIVIIGKNGSFFREEIDYSKFQNEIAVACQNDDYNGIVLDKDISFDETLEKLSNIDNNKLTINKNLFDNDKKSFFAKLDYTFKEQDGNYVVYSKFGLKRLIVQGDLTNFYGAKNVISGFKDYNILCYETEEETKVAYENLIKDKNLSVNVDFIVSTSDYADNSYDYSSYKSWGAEAIGVAPYLDYLEDEKMTSKEVVVAVIDTGINTSHEMFNGRFLLDDNDEIIGYSYSQTKYTYSGYAFEDDNGHGTHVSGIICDVTPSNVKILPIRALDDKGDGSFTNILAGLSLVESLINKYDFACVNMSLGNKSSSFDEDSHNSFNNLFSSLRNQGVLCAVAAGNESINVSQGVLSSCESAIVVSALKQDITFAYKFDNTYSNFGAIDVSAPGSNIKSAYKSSLNTANSKVYHNESGTSMATPFVAGAISLIYLEQTSLTNFNNLTSDFADKIENILKENTLDFGDKGYDEYYGYGLVNLKYFNVEKKGDLITFKNDNLNSEIVTTGDYYHFTQSFTLSLDFSDDYEILYTDDGTIPNLNSKKYVSSIEITETVPMCFMGVKFDSKGNISEITNFYNIVFFNSGESIWSYLDYYSTNGKVYITTYTGHFKNLVIPDAVYDNKGFVGNVVAIRSEVFKQNSALESVTLPSTCTRVYSKSFYNCINLKKVDLGGVSVIDEMAFYDCIELEEINALNVTEIYNYSFFNTNIKNIVSNKSYVKDGETYAYFPKLLNCGEGTFSYCDNLTYVYLEKYESLSNYCFAESKNLKTCILPTLLSIGDFAFINCSSLVDFEIGKNVMIIGKTAFVGTGLPNIKLNNNNKYFYTDGNGLYNNKKLITYKSNNKNSYIVLDSVIINGKTYQITTIDDMAFDSALLSRLTIPTNISFIGGNCFKYASVDTIEFYAKNCLKDNYNIEGYVYPIFYETKIKNFNVYDIESIPANFFSKANIENLYIKKYNISYDLTAFNEVKIKNLYLDFSNTIDLNYFSNVIGVRILYGLENIYARTKFNPFTFNNGQSTIYYIDYKNNYYLYSSNSSAKFDIFYSVTDKVVTYDGKYHNISVNVNISNSYSITYSTDGVNYNITNINSVGDFKNATNGQKTIYFKITASGYNDTYGLGYLTINKVSLKVKIGDLSGTYGDIPNVDGVSYDIIDGSLVFGESIKLNFNTNATKLSSVGEYKIFGELDKSENNYTVTFEDGKYNINKKSLVVKVNDITGIYGELSLSHNDYTVDKNHGDIVNNDDLGVTLIYSTTTFDTGIYDITFTWTNNNYDVTFEKGTLTINKRQVYIVINNSSSTYGEKIVLKGKGEGYLITNGSFVNDDETICDFKITTTATSFSDVNGAGYIISSQYNEMKNYDIYVTNGTYTVLKRVIDFKANDSSSAYGDDIKLNGYTITSGSFKNDDLNLANISVLTDATSLSNYGSYDITFNYENLNNYTFNFINGKYEILKRVVKYKIYDSLSYYGENVVKNDYEIIEGNFIGDDENLCDFDINFSITNRTVSGEYKVKAVYNSLDNYEIVCDDGKYQVLKRKIKLQINNHYGTYGDEISLKAYEIINGSFIDEDIKDFSINLSTTATITSDIGSYEINGTCKSMQNYEFYIEKGIYIINPRQVQIKLLNQSGIYGYAPALEPIYEVTYGSIVNNDDLILSLSTCADSNSSVGEYIITGKSNNKNYDCIITLGTYVVGKREIKIELLSQKAPHLGRFEIDQNAYKIVYGTVLTDDKLNVSINSDYKKTSFWSEYSINATYDNKNYDVVFVNASNSLDENNSSDDGSQSIATLKVEISIYDGLILLAILIIIIFIIVFICKATSRKKKKNKKKKGTKKKSSKKTSSNQKKKSSSKKSNKK